MPTIEIEFTGVAEVIEALRRATQRSLEDIELFSTKLETMRAPIDVRPGDVLYISGDDGWIDITATVVEPKRIEGGEDDDA